MGADDPRATTNGGTTRAMVSLAWAAAAAAFVYSAARVARVALSPEADPAAIVWTAHWGITGRLAVAAFVAVPVALGAWAAGRDRSAALARWLPRVVAVAAAAVAVQATFVP